MIVKRKDIRKMNDDKAELTAIQLARIALDEARGIRFSRDKRMLTRYPSALPDRSYDLPPGVTAIRAMAFDRCGNLERLWIPDSVKRIGNFAFSECTALTEIDLPDSVTAVGEYVFCNCTALKKVRFSRALKKIGIGIKRLFVRKERTK